LGVTVACPACMALKAAWASKGGRFGPAGAARRGLNASISATLVVWESARDADASHRRLTAAEPF
jgi:hypothetical protein